MPDEIVTNGFYSHKTQHPLLCRHVAYYYFEKYGSEDYYRKYTFFPHIYSSITCYKDAHAAPEPEAFVARHRHGSFSRLRLIQQRTPHTVVQDGPFERIGIAFLPLGINQFCAEDFIDLAPLERQYFLPQNLKEWEEATAACFNASGVKAKAAIIDGFLLRQFQKKDFDTLGELVRLLSEGSNKETMGELSGRFGLSRRTMLRHFKTHLGMSPELFREIARFRHAVTLKMKEGATLSLTSLAYESGFSDQAFMIRTFRKFAGTTPKRFFDEGVLLGNEDTFWKVHRTLSQ